MTTLRILVDHVCPNCRAPREGWEIKGVEGPKGALRPGAIMPEGMNATEARDKCDACGQAMTGHLAIDDERPEGGEGIRLLAIESVPANAARIVERMQRRRRLDAMLRREGGES